MNIEDINVFYIKQVKKYNDLNNKLRENIIYNIIKNIIPNEWYILQPLWNNLKIKLENIIKLIGINIHYNNLDIELKGGRKFNYDFIIYYKLNENIEFKYNTTNINNYPQFLSVSANKFILSIDYAEYFYDNYIDTIAGLIQITKPNKKDYLKYIYNNDYNKLLFFKELKSKEYLIKNQKKKLVCESIQIYLNNTFQTKQYNKHYILYHNNNFYQDTINNDELTIINIETIKNNNTLILNTKTNTKIAMLLRWKNNLGILYPVWQISIIR